MNNIAIKVENLSKAYQLGEIGTGTISRDLERWWAKLRGKDDPFLRIGEINRTRDKGKSDIIWSLKDLHFEVEQGDAVGIIGRNGAGKSTLLKILSRVTAPTTGLAKIKGRIASLLEVGTGFHPELTGRENIFLNGAILGMRKAEIKRKFEEIVDFAGVERYIDTPVKRYSSGMYVRLAFAVAAHLESEILIVDEVLAVGDAEFQKKCLGKMGAVSKGEGRTVLFVSHNMASIHALCKKGIVLNNGVSTPVLSIKEAIDSYTQLLNKVVINDMEFAGNLKDRIIFNQVLVNERSGHNNTLNPSDPISFTVKGISKTNFKRIVFIIGLSHNGIRLFTLPEHINGRTLTAGDFKVIFNLSAGFLRPGKYTIAIGAWGETDHDWIWGPDLSMFEIGEMWTEHIRKQDEGIINGDFLRIK
ncbi:MAG: ABC transporter ATP-binding protein [Candidatus Pedobacter colombiensis]|uniref:ABC transporter ATP-binding protein n=1 Tax=Candidatus Pedobacter colombiensis TaxID=3121371 RepID=A0AAJ5W7Z0_9SPHI|nr:ABC transporter ATP-binding protein [Pedobacter sp.]WEK19702.1 MAG: ABC transporter ATP-binding protein [Pedobacter sp.]